MKKSKKNNGHGGKRVGSGAKPGNKNASKKDRYGIR